MTSIDLNCDLGESFGAYVIGHDLAVLPHVTSANIACGFHGGDPTVMRRTVAAALAHGVRIGAHPGLPDLAGFGRREMAITPDEAYDMTLYQIGALQVFAHAAQTRVHHVKPHGALYNMAARTRPLADAIARTRPLADAIARAVRDADRQLILVGLAGSALIDAGRDIGLAVAQEVFADRAYRSDGSLVPRTEAGAVITDAAHAAQRAVEMVRTGTVLTVDGTHRPISADTICIHGDHANAAALAARLRSALDGAGIAVRGLATAP
jgi:5-oxoprolinase (ATP-hydrolysing) subunit A